MAATSQWRFWIAAVLSVIVAGALLALDRDWANAAVTDFRVRLVVAVKSGDLDAARALARGRTAALPLPMRDDVLCDLVLATSGDGFSSDDRERLAGELDDDADRRARAPYPAREGA